MHKQLMEHLERNSLLFKHQFGFRSKRSTELAVALFTDFIRKEADNGSLTGAIFIDLLKAFDLLKLAIQVFSTSCHRLEFVEKN